MHGGMQKVRIYEYGGLIAILLCYDITIFASLFENYRYIKGNSAIICERAVKQDFCRFKKK